MLCHRDLSVPHIGTRAKNDHREENLHQATGLLLAPLYQERHLCRTASWINLKGEQTDDNLKFGNQMDSSKVLTIVLKPLF